MATVKFQLLSASNNAPIYLRLSIKRGLTPRTKTGLHINPKDWSKTTGLPKQNININKNLSSKLLKLQTYILDKYNEANSTGTSINTKWLKHKIDVFFERTNENNISELLTDAIQNIIDEAATRQNSKGGIGLSKSRIDSFKTLKRSIIEYQKSESFKVKDVDVKFGKDYLKHLINKKNYQQSTAIKKIADLKTVCKEAEVLGIEVNQQYKKIKSSRKNNENILYLTLDELQKIENKDLTKEAHLNARKWLLLGCNLGQRGSDLLKLNETNFVTRNGYELIELTQQKTGKNVTIPVLETTRKILENGLPYKISIQKFNKLIKEICELAEINEMIEGNLITVTEKGKGNKEKRKIKGIYPKYKLMSSHVCRRSFATNLYGELPTALIMQITAHSSERMLLNYIGKSPLDFAQQIADFYTLQAIKKEKEPKLKVIKNTSLKNTKSNF